MKSPSSASCSEVSDESVRDSSGLSAVAQAYADSSETWSQAARSGSRSLSPASCVTAAAACRTRSIRAIYLSRFAIHVASSVPTRLVSSVSAVSRNSRARATKPVRHEWHALRSDSATELGGTGAPSSKGVSQDEISEEAHFVVFMYLVKEGKAAGRPGLPPAQRYQITWRVPEPAES